MPNYTKNYNLKKPLQEEFYNIDDHNGNMDILDEALKILSEKSGVVISPDEPETGDVWIDTDDETGGSVGDAVSSVNGKTGEVMLNPSDIGAISSINGKTGSDVNLTAEDLGESFTNHTHAASSITSGTFAGAVSASNGGQTPSDYLVRNQKLSASVENPTVNGAICWQYE